ncbi:hypothetical protein Tco_0621786, partial [Tanacetum coccineum]
LRTQAPTKRFVISSDSTPAPNNNVVDDEVTSIVRSAAPVSAILTMAVVKSASVLAPQTNPGLVDTRIYAPKWDVVNDFGLENPDVCQSFIDHLAPPGFFSQLRALDYDQLFADFNIGATRQSCFNTEDEVTKFRKTPPMLPLSRKRKVLDVKDSRSFATEKFRSKLMLDWGCRDYAVKKGMQDGLSFGITHGKEGRVLTDVVAYNPSTEDDYVSALKDLQQVNFYLLTDLRSNKDASTEAIMDVLRLDDSLAERLGLRDSQPHVDQLMVPIHYSLDKTVVRATSLSFSMSVSSARVQKIRENIASQRSSLCDVFIPLVKPISTVALEGTEGTSITAPITTAAITTVVSSGVVSSISTNNYEVVGAEESANADFD